jgi:hypothetical protein
MRTRLHFSILFKTVVKVVAEGFVPSRIQKLSVCMYVVRSSCRKVMVSFISYIKKKSDKLGWNRPMRK